MRESTFPVVLWEVLSKKTDAKYWSYSSQICQMKVIWTSRCFFKKVEVCKSGGYLLESENKFCHFPGEFYSPPYVYTFSFLMFVIHLSPSPVYEWCCRIDDWEGCRNGENVATVMWCNSWHLHNDGEFRQPRVVEIALGTLTFTEKSSPFLVWLRITKRKIGRKLL